MDEAFADMLKDLGYARTRVFDQVAAKIDREPLILNCQSPSAKMLGAL